MGLFFVISGFVMILGCGQKQFSSAGGIWCECCCALCDGFYCCRPSDNHQTQYTTSGTVIPPVSSRIRIINSDADANLTHPPIVKPSHSQRHLSRGKKIASLGPVYFLTNLHVCAVPLFLFISLSYLYAVIPS